MNFYHILIDNNFFLSCYILRHKTANGSLDRVVLPPKMFDMYCNYDEFNTKDKEYGFQSLIERSAKGRQYGFQSKIERSAKGRQYEIKFRRKIIYPMYVSDDKIVSCIAEDMKYICKGPFAALVYVSRSDKSYNDTRVKDLVRKLKYKLVTEYNLERQSPTKLEKYDQKQSPTKLEKYYRFNEYEDWLICENSS